MMFPTLRTLLAAISIYMVIHKSFADSCRAVCLCLRATSAPHENLLLSNANKLVVHCVMRVTN